MQQSKFAMLSDMEMGFLVDFSYYAKLLKPKKYFTKQDFVMGLSRKMNLDNCAKIHRLYKNGIDVRRVADKFLLEMNSNASIVKNLYVDRVFREEIRNNISNDVMFFEFNVNGFRTDINRVNKMSYAIEIKSMRDRLDNAFDQTRNFSEVFDYVILIAHQNNVDKLESIPDNVGIILYDYRNGEMFFKTERKSKKNLELDPVRQLWSLTKNSLCDVVGIDENVSKKSIISDILSSHSERQVNTIFKDCLKQSHYPEWKNYINQKILN